MYSTTKGCKTASGLLLLASVLVLRIWCHWRSCTLPSRGTVN